MVYSWIKDKSHPKFKANFETFPRSIFLTNMFCTNILAGADKILRGRIKRIEDTQLQDFHMLKLLRFTSNDAEFRKYQQLMSDKY